MVLKKFIYKNSITELIYKKIDLKIYYIIL